MTYTLNMAPSKSRPTYIGFINTIMLPISFIPTLTGVLLRIMSYEWVFVLSALVSVFAVYFSVKLSNVEERDDIESKDE